MTEVNQEIIAALSAKDRVYAEELQKIDPSFVDQIRLLVTSAGMNIKGYREEATGRVFYMLLDTTTEGVETPPPAEDDDDEVEVPAAPVAPPRPAAAPGEIPGVPVEGAPRTDLPTDVEIYALDLKTKILSSGKTKVEFYAADADNADAVNRFLTRAGGAETIVVRFRIIKPEGKPGEKSVPASPPIPEGSMKTIGAPPANYPAYFEPQVSEKPLAFDVRKGVGAIPGAHPGAPALPALAVGGPLEGGLHSPEGNLVPAFGAVEFGVGELPAIAGGSPGPDSPDAFRSEIPRTSGGEVSRPPAAELIPVMDASGKIVRYIEAPSDPSPAVPDKAAGDIRDGILRNPGLSPGTQSAMIGLVEGETSGGVPRRI